MTGVILGNVFSLLAAISDSVSGTRKEPRSVLGVQIISQLFYSASSFVLKGYSAIVQSVVAIFRNLLAMSGKKIPVLEWLFTVAAVIFGVVFNNRGLLGLLPVLANLEYTVCVFRFKTEENKLKTAFIVNMLMFTVFNVSILNFVGAVMNLAVAVSTFISLRKNRRPE